MKARFRKPRAKQGRGSVLMYTVLMLSLASISVYGVIRLATTNLNEVRRSEARIQAFYGSEAGVQQVIDWFNRGYYTFQFAGTETQTAGADAPLVYEAPQQLSWISANKKTPAPTPTPSPTASPTATPSGSPTPPPAPVSDFERYTWSDGRYPSAAFQEYFAPDPTTGRYITETGESKITQTLEIADEFASYLPQIKNADGQTVAKIVRLRITPPAEDDPAGTVAQVYCDAEVVAFDSGPNTPHTRCQVHVWLYDNRFVDIKIPAAIMSGMAIETAGQFNVGWGEVWAKDTIDFPNTSMNGVPTTSEDPWYHARSEQYITVGGSYADGTSQGGTSSSPIAAGADNYYVPYLESTLDSRNWNKFGGRENLHQHAQGLRWPRYDYKSMKALAKELDSPIFGTTSSGDLYLDTASGRVEKSFAQWFGDQIVILTPTGYTTSPISPDTVDESEMPPIYFIDTTDGLEPAVDGHNLATVDAAGHGPFIYGLFFGAANFDFAGQGNSPTVQGEKPDGTIESISKCFLQGLLYSYGSVDKHGSGSVYGSIFAERGYTARGCPDVYYDWRLSDVLRNRLGSSLKPRLWEYRYYEASPNPGS